MSLEVKIASVLVARTDLCRLPPLVSEIDVARPNSRAVRCGLIRNCVMDTGTIETCGNRNIKTGLSLVALLMSVALGIPIDLTSPAKAKMRSLGWSR